MTNVGSDGFDVERHWEQHGAAQVKTAGVLLSESEIAKLKKSLQRVFSTLNGLDEGAADERQLLLESAQSIDQARAQFDAVLLQGL
jgi:hypothetical protein